MRESFKLKFSEDKALSWALVILSLGIFIRFIITFFVSPSGDSLSHLNAARFIAENNYFPLFEPIYPPFFYYPPLFHLVAAGLYKSFILFGGQIATKAMDFVAPIFGSASLILFYHYCKRLVSSKITLYSVIFLTFIPMHMYYSTLAHVDIAAMFIVLAIMYSVTFSRIWFAGFVGGLGMLTKYTVMFIFPTVIYGLWQRAKKNQSKVKNILIFFGTTIIIGSPLYIRNLIKLGNPMWPFLNNLVMAMGLQPLLVETRPAPTLLHLSELLIAPLRAYLDTYGVPLGIPEHLLSIPMIPLVGWIGMTVLFSTPLIVGLFIKKPKNIVRVFSIWIGTYVVMFVYYIYDFGVPFFRLLLPIFPALAIIWGYGLNHIAEKVPKKNRIAIFILLFIICIGFVGVEFAKPQLAKSLNAPLMEDYDWIKENIPSDKSYFYPHQPAIIYFAERQVVSMLKKPEDYDGTIYHHTSTHFKEKHQDITPYENWELIYDNPDTGGKIFQKP